jgi:acyl-coenzyme A thioesterase PaaI-like protein
MFPGGHDFLNRLKKKIRNRVLRGLALNRRPGFHFPGNFLDVSFDRVGRKGVRLSIDPGPWCADSAGEADLGALAILADLALGASIRAQLSRETRVATVSLGVQFTGAPRTGRLRAAGEFQGFFEGASGRLGLSRVAVTGSAGQICYGTGSFMALPPPKGVTLHPVPLRSRNSGEPERISEQGLSGTERQILNRADVALAAPGNFIEKFWGGPVLANDLHAGNRVGHAQGGILVAMAAQSAAALLPSGWRLSGISALYISPGEGKVLRAKSTLIHHGRLTAVVHTQVTGKTRRRVLEVVSTHCAPGARRTTAGR